MTDTFEGRCGCGAATYRMTSRPMHFIRRKPG
jgi:hypothetical protein